MSEKFSLESQYQPAGDQPQAIKKLVAGLQSGFEAQTLLGVTGSGKTFTMANVVAQLNRPTLVISHNKTLAAQLAAEFREFFPNNAVHYFVSYYDYYQPEAYIPRSDTYIEKESQVNEEIDRLRNAATQALLTRRDVLIVASVSCIYGLGNPVEYQKAAVPFSVGQSMPRTELLRQLNQALYERNDYDFKRGTYRVRGDIIDILPAYSEDAIRLELDGQTITGIQRFDFITSQIFERYDQLTIFPGRQFVAPPDRMPQILKAIEAEAKERVAWFEKNHKPLEAERLQQRTSFDIDMLRETGFCNGIENYSRFFDGRASGQPPSTLLDYFPKDFLLFVDESHMSIPQIHGMYAGDKSRKDNLVDYGFRLPSALDNRPLKYEEFLERVHQRVFVSATPAPYEIEKSKQVVEQLIRPTGLLDPEITIRPTKHQIDDVLAEVRATVAKKERVLITTLTKRMAEDLTEYFDELKIKAQYLHSDIETFERLEILRDLRLGKYDVVIGINLLREGLDLPEVSLVMILDADKEGFLRSESALMQVMGRAARHVKGRVIMYADRVTGSMERAIAETKRRRVIQEQYNTKHGITPASITKAIRDNRLSGSKEAVDDEPTYQDDQIPVEDLGFVIRQLTEKMDMAAKNLEFEKAASLRDHIKQLEARRPKSDQNRFSARGRGKKSKATPRFGRR